MPYLNIDDGMYDHEKVDALSDAAFRLHITAMMFCARNMTDGFIRRTKARRLTSNGNDIVITELLNAGVWHDVDQGCVDGDCIESRTCPPTGKPGSYLIHDYLQWNHSRDWWERRRKENAERQRKFKARRNGGANE